MLDIYAATGKDYALIHFGVLGMKWGVSKGSGGGGGSSKSSKSGKSGFDKDYHDLIKYEEAEARANGNVSGANALKKEAEEYAKDNKESRVAALRAKFDKTDPSKMSAKELSEFNKDTDPMFSKEQQGVMSPKARAYIIQSSMGDYPKNAKVNDWLEPAEQLKNVTPIKDYGDGDVALIKNGSSRVYDFSHETKQLYDTGKDVETYAKSEYNNKVKWSLEWEMEHSDKGGSTMQQHDEQTLAHFGVMGMKWGVRNGVGSARSTRSETKSAVKLVKLKGANAQAVGESKARSGKLALKGKTKGLAKEAKFKAKYLDDPEEFAKYEKTRKGISGTAKTAGGLVGGTQIGGFGAGFTGGLAIASAGGLAAFTTGSATVASYAAVGAAALAGGAVAVPVGIAVGAAAAGKAANAGYKAVKRSSANMQSSGKAATQKALTA